ncbi:MAG: glycosyltransferase family 39 protein [Anaerolineae bacterium]|nr:glycosyltransferase family 39 protein [Anaerolineae bacterium]
MRAYTSWILRRKEGLAVASILLLAGIARFYALDFGLPYLRHPDESKTILHALRFWSGDLNPHFFIWPAFNFYMVSGLYGLLYLFGLLRGTFHSTSDLLVSFSSGPTPFYLMGRILAASLGTATVGLVYLLGKRAYSAATGLIGALFMAFAPLHVEESHYALLDVPCTFFILLSSIFILSVLIKGRRQDYLLAGFLAGLATAVKYNALFLILPFILAQFQGSWSRGKSAKGMFLDTNIYLGLASMALGFFLGSPYTILDWRHSWLELAMLSSRVSSGTHLGFEDIGSGWIYHLTVNLRDGLGLSLLVVALLGVCYASYRHKDVDKVLVSFPLVYYAIIGSSRVVFPRYVLPLLPFLLLLGAEVVVEGTSRFLRGSARSYALTGISLALVAMPAFRVTIEDYALTLHDTRTTAYEWVEANIPKGARLLVGDYGPPRLEANYEVFHLSAFGLVNEPNDLGYDIEEVRERGIEYVIISSLVYERHLNSPDYYPGEVAFYSALEQEVTLIYEISPQEIDWVIVKHPSPGPTIKIYRIE